MLILNYLNLNFFILLRFNRVLRSMVPVRLIIRRLLRRLRQVNARFGGKKTARRSRGPQQQRWIQLMQCCITIQLKAYIYSTPFKVCARVSQWCALQSCQYQAWYPSWSPWSGCLHKLVPWGIWLAWCWKSWSHDVLTSEPRTLLWLVHECVHDFQIRGSACLWVEFVNTE